ncbi:MAG: NAD(P)-dependent oxidoreductase [Candidatus Hodarchaeota archaeon]
MRLGFIGVGNMGKPMATNLLKANHQLAIYDINSKPLEELAKLGAVAKDKPSEIPPSAEMIFLSLPSHIVSEEVMLGVDGVVSTLQKGQIVVDMTTSLPSVSRKIAEKVKAKGADFLDASVSGGPDGAAAQTLTFMVGGEARVLEKVRGLLETLGKKIFYVGPSGSGNTMKLVNNLIGITNTACFMEGLILGTKAGINPATLFEVITSCSGNSYAFQKKAPRILDGNFKAMFALDLEYKDLYLGTMLAEELKSPIFLGSVARQLFEMARARGLGSEDNIALIKVFEELSNVQVRK